MSGVSDVDGIRLTIADGVGRITLTRPDVGNAIDLPMARAMFRAAIRCETDADVRCVVVAGEGRLFCAGGDIGAMTAAGDKLPEMLTELVGQFHAAMQRLARMPKPLVTLIQGPAAGAGLSLAILGDIAIAARSAHFTPAYSGIGLTADGGLSWLMPRLVGQRKAQEIILTNRRVKADEAEAIGLVTRTVDDEALAAEGGAVADKLVAAPTAALGATRALLRESYESSFETQLDRELASMATASAGTEIKEGLAAFLAKRPPVFK